MANVVVTVTDARGVSYPVTTGLDGNFYLEPLFAIGFTAPYKVSLTLNGNTRTMVSSQSAGGCNSCHTQAGANGAPGRILQP